MVIMTITLVNDKYVYQSIDLYTTDWQISLASLSDCLGLVKISYMEKWKQRKGVCIYTTLMPNQGLWIHFTE